MDRDARRLARLAGIQRRLEQIAESELASVAGQRAVLAERLEAVAEALASPEPVFVPFTRVFGGQLGRLKTKDQVLATRQEAQQRRLHTERAKAERLEERAGQARDMETRKAQEEALFDLLDRAGAGDLRR